MAVTIRIQRIDAHGLIMSDPLKGDKIPPGLVDAINTELAKGSDNGIVEADGQRYWWLKSEREAET